MQKVHYFEGIERQSFFLYIALGLALGFSCGYMLFSYEALLPGIISLLLLFKSYKKGKGYFFAFLMPFLLLLIFGLLHAVIPLKNGANEVHGLVIQSKNNYFVFFDGWNKYYVYEKDCTREVGDILCIKGYLAPYEGIEYESRFSFGDYLAKSGIKTTISISESRTIFLFPLRLREKEMKFLSSFDSLTSSLIDSLLFGRKDYSSEIISNASYIGCLTLLSSSGLIYGGFLNILDKLFGLKFDEMKRKTITYVIAIFLLPLNLGKIGIYRVFLMRTIDLLFTIKKQKLEYITLLSIAAIIILAIDPYQVMSSGFLIGFGLPLFLSLTRMYLYGLKRWQKRIMSFLFLIVFLLPFYNIKGELKLFAPLFTFIFTPISYSFSFISFVSLLSVPNVLILEKYASFINKMIIFLGNIELSVPLGAFPNIGIIVYYVSIFAALYFKEIGFTPFKRIFQFAAIVSLVAPSLPIAPAITQQVSFINVGQGDAIFIRDRFTNVLIDTGGTFSFDIAREVDIPFFRKEKVYKLDYLITSHSDFDHSGGVNSLLKHFKVSNVINDSSSFPLKIGNLEFVNYNIYGGEGNNEKSLVLGLSFMGKNYLFTGDADAKIEKKIIQDNPSMDVDILKVGHHGSKTSSSYEFLKVIKPDVAIISVGKNNKYGHPDKEVLERLNKLGIKIRRTDIEGTITYKTYFGLPLGDL